MRSLHFTNRYSAIHRLADGTPVRLRLLRPSDRDWLLRSFARLSPESRYFRFFAPMRQLPEKTLQRLLSVDGTSHVAIAAESVTDGAHSGEGAGVARFIRLADAPDMADVAVAVVDHMQRRGLGTLLLSTLAAAARERGITRFRAEVLRNNRAMTALLRHFDTSARPVLDGPVAIYEVRLPEPPEEVTSGPFLDEIVLRAHAW